MTIVKKHYNLMTIPALIIIIISLLSGFTYHDDEELLKSMLIERTQILQDGFFGMTDRKYAENMITELEVQPILSEDVKNLRGYEQTDMDRVEKMTFVSVEKKSNFMGYITFEVQILWDMRSPEGKYETYGTYHTVLKKTGNSYYLSKFELNM